MKAVANRGGPHGGAVVGHAALRSPLERSPVPGPPVASEPAVAALAVAEAGRALAGLAASIVARPWRSSFCIASSSGRSHCSRADSRSPRRQRCGKAASSSAERHRVGQRLARARSRRLTRPIASASSPPTPRPVRIRSIARLWPMSRGSRIVPRSTSGTPKRRQYTPSIGVAGGDPQVAPQRDLEAAGDGVALDGGDHRLAEPQAGRRPSGRRRRR